VRGKVRYVSVDHFLLTVGRERVRVKVNYRRMGQFYSNVAADRTTRNARYFLADKNLPESTFNSKSPKMTGDSFISERARKSAL